MYVPYLWLIPTKDLQNVKTHKPSKAVLTQTPQAMYVYYKPFASVKVVFEPTVPRYRRQHCCERRCFGFARLTFR